MARALAEKARRQKARLWKPFQGPQTQAFNHPADELFYGGAAGGGKSDLLLGLAISSHRKTLLLRRESVQLVAIVERLKEICGATGSWRSSGHGGVLRIDNRLVELAGCEHEDDKHKYQGRPHDLKAFDELSHFSRTQFRFIIGWNRTDLPHQRCRVVAAGNPPTTPEGRWVIEEWAPWLDPLYHDPAAPGELRFYTYLDGKIAWFRSGNPIVHKGETIRPRSRTFIPARVQDNPIYMQTGYMATLQAMPEPLRSQLLYGDMLAGGDDDPYQCIPTEWIRLAQRRWIENGGDGIPLSCLGVDVARGGADQTVLSRRHLKWFAPLEKHKGKSTPDGSAVVKLISAVVVEHPRVPVNIDVIGVGSSVYDLARQLEYCEARGINFATGTTRVDRSGKLGFCTLRSYAYWSLREALDPEHGEGLMLPPDPELLADLAAPKWELRVSGIQVESKESIVERLGRSPDCGDALVLAALPTYTFEAPTSLPAPPRARESARINDVVSGREGRGRRLFGGS